MPHYIILYCIVLCYVVLCCVGCIILYYITLHHTTPHHTTPHHTTPYICYFTPIHSNTVFTVGAVLTFLNSSSSCLLMWMCLRFGRCRNVTPVPWKQHRHCITTRSYTTVNTNTSLRQTRWVCVGRRTGYLATTWSGPIELFLVPASVPRLV